MTKRTYKLPPFPIQWTCTTCSRGSLTVQRDDELRAVACRLCELVFCAACSARHTTGGEWCRRGAGGSSVAA